MNNKGDLKKDLTMKNGSGGVLLAVFKYMKYLKKKKGGDKRELEKIEGEFDKAL